MIIVHVRRHVCTICMHVADQSVAASGEWITAYQANQTKQLRAVWSKLSVPSASSSHVLKPPVTTPISDALNVTLNRYFLVSGSLLHALCA